MKFKLTFFFLLISTLLVATSCGLQPGKGFAGKATGTAISQECYNLCSEKYLNGELSRSEVAICVDRCPQESGETAGSTEETGFGGGECTDSDKGKSFLEKGKVEVAGEVKEDFCHIFPDGSVYLFESICGDAKYGNDPWYYVQKKCEEGGIVAGLEPAGTYQCVEGKCMKKGEVVSETCKDSDGGSDFSSFTMKGTVSIGGKNQGDYCDYSETLHQQILIEGSCLNNKYVPVNQSCDIYGPGYECNDGACKQLFTCIDDDSENSPSKKGSVKVVDIQTQKIDDGPIDDFCTGINKITNKNESVTDSYCSWDYSNSVWEIKSKKVTCSQGTTCQEGVCK